ncbi:MAG: hypothetical protein JWP52_1776 [Rhizobacter sp.]|jgi:hypothetical protein|nr:hypothetical protein [Rhizobacter sp.]
MKLKSLLAAMMLAAASMASHAVTFELVPVGTLEVGQSFDLQLHAVNPFQGQDPDESLLSFGFHLEFDTNMLQFGSFTVAAGFDNDSAGLGANIFSASAFPFIDNAGQTDLLLGTLHFDALRRGMTGVNLFTDASDLHRFQGFSYLFADTIDLNASTGLTIAPIPEPSTVMLMAGGLAGLAAWRRRSVKVAKQAETV